MIYENHRPLTQIEKDERTYSDFNEIVTPLLKWCYENTDSSFKDRVKNSKGNMIVFSSNGELQIKNSVYLCLTSNQFRESLIEQNVEKYKLKVIEKYRIASNHKYFGSLNSEITSPVYETIEKMKLFTLPARDEQGNVIYGYGDMLVCKPGNYLSSASVLYHRPDLPDILREYSPEEEQESICYDVNWISYKHFKKYAETCSLFGCNVTGFIDKNDELNGLNVSVHPLSYSVENFMKNKYENLQNSLSKTYTALDKHIFIDELTKNRIANLYSLNR
jgi:hypothetical protein